MPLARRLMILLLAAATLLAACGGAPPQPTPTPVAIPPTALPQPGGDIPAPPAQAAPTLIARSPAQGEALAPGAPIELVFDRPMDRASVAAALSVAGVTGAVSWPDARTARFTPATSLQRAATYEVALGDSAKAADGTPLAAPLRFRFATAGFLEVGQVIPADGASEVQPGATITVFFNRPVVPLTAVEAQGNLPQPLTFNPPIQGRGEWLNTAIYTFTPAAPLAGGTTYTGRIAAGLADVSGNPLQADYTWSFTVARPQVVTIDPADGATLVPLQPPITLTFNVPIDPAAARAAFRLQSAGGDIPGNLQVDGATLSFTPTQRLEFDTSYTVVVAASLTGSSGGLGMASEFRATLRTVPLPRILNTDPADGATDVQPGSGFAIRFNAPIDAATVMPNVTITPAPTEVYTYFNEFDTTFYIGLDARPSSDYTITIGPNIADPYGNLTGQSLTVRFRTAPLRPSAYLLTPGFVATYDAARAPRTALMATNTAQAALALYRLPLETVQSREFLAPDGSGPPTGANLLRRWQAQFSVPRDEPTMVRLDLTENGALLEPGVYLLLLDQPANSPQGHVLIVSNYHLTLKSAERDALIWATDLASGAPAANLAFELFDEQGSPLGQATTGADGVATATFNRTENRGMLAVSRQPFAAFAAGWGSGVSPWDFGLQGGYDLPELAAYVYTDRPIYRPGQQVWFKGALRAENDVRFSLLQGANPIQLTIYDAAGEQIAQQAITLSQNGTFDGGFMLAAGAPTGQYSINLDVGGQSFYFGFQVAAYRPPEIEVAVSPRDTAIIRGAPTEATVRAGYFFGAPAADLPVQWNVLSEPFAPAPDWAGRYTFGESDGPWVCRFCWWLPAPQPQPILSGSATTDAQGQATISLPGELRDTQGNVITRSVRLTVEATVTGRDNQAISGRSAIVVHAGEMYIGLAPHAYVGKAGDEQQIDLVTIDTQGNRLANRTVEVELFRTTWENRFIEDDAGGSWESREVRESAGTQQITTDGSGEAVVNFTPADGGAYLVLARARDSAGREVRTSLFVWVYGGDAFWLRENNDRINLIADKGEYRPGETATILIPSPFTGPHWALLTVERGGVLSHEVRQVNGGSLVYQLPITAAHAPNIYVSATLFSPRDANAPPDYKVGILPLSVVPTAQTLNVAVTPATPRAGPGETTSFNVLVTDTSGAPVAAELSLDLVDKAILTLQPRTPNAIMTAFYDRRPLAVFTSAGLSIAAERFERLLDEEAARQSAPPGAGDMLGGGGMAADGEAVPAAAPMAERAAEGAAAPAGLTVREEFADTAFWQAVVTTDGAGRATVQVRLPDNLTTWVMRGVALTGDTRAGEGTGELISTKALLVRPVTPRFFVVGDVAELSANVSNTTNSPLTAEIALSVAGLTVNTPLTQTIQIPANGEATARWQVTALDVEAADLIFSVVSGQLSDAARPRLASAPEGRIPVYRYSAPETVATGGQLEAAGARAEAIALPPNVDTRLGELRVRLDPSLAAGILDGLKALENYPYDSVEATVSRFVPNVVAVRALRRLGVANATLEAELPARVTDALDQLYLWQNPDGGWGWWSGNESSPYMTAYVVFGMLRAREAGFTVRDDVVNFALDYLAAAMNAGSATGRMDDENVQAWMLYILSDGGRPDSGRVDLLYSNRERLGIAGKSFLALTMHRANAGDARLKTLLSDLNTAAIVSATGMHWEEPEPYYWSLGGDTRSSAIALATLVRLDPQNQIIPNAVRWLMVARRGDIWQTTQESAWALIALTDWMEVTGELNGAYDYAVWFNGGERAAGTVTATNVTSPTILRIPMAELAAQQPAGGSTLLAVGRSDGPGRLYYTAQLNLALPADQAPALDRGIAVTRRYVAADCSDGPRCPEIDQVKLGDTVRVELSVVAERDLYYLRVEDPLPAGAEAIDPNLATTALAVDSVPSVTPQSNDRGLWWWWWPWYNRAELRDEKVALFADYLPRGAYLFSYTFRATLPGEYRVIPTTAQEDFFPEVFGRSDGRLFTITP